MACATVPEEDTAADPRVAGGRGRLFQCFSGVTKTLRGTACGLPVALLAMFKVAATAPNPGRRG